MSHFSLVCLPVLFSFSSLADKASQQFAKLSQSWVLDVQEQALVAVVVVEWSLQVHHQVDPVVLMVSHGDTSLSLLEVSKPANGLCSLSSLDSADCVNYAKKCKKCKKKKCTK